MAEGGMSTLGELRNEMAECLHVSLSERHPRAHPYGHGGGIPNACTECIENADMMAEFVEARHRTIEQEVLAFLYRKRDGALSGATRVVYAEVISAIEGDLFGDPNETSTPRRFDDRAVLCDRDAPAADHRRRSSGSDLRPAVRDRRYLAAERRPSADPLEGVQVSGAIAELLLKCAHDEQIAEVEALQRTFQERRRTHPSPLHSDGGQAE
jgi:hypothetical protein